MANNYFSKYNDGTTTYYARAKAPGQSSSWVKGRDNALIATTSISSYTPLLSLKSSTGSWEMGAYDQTGSEDFLLFTHVSDSNYINNTNTDKPMMKLSKDGHLIVNNHEVFNEGYLDVSKASNGILGATYGGTGQNTLNKSANALINALSTGGSTPVDNDYFISQYVDGGTATTTYHRRPISTLWEYIQPKAAAIKLWPIPQTYSTNTISIQNTRTSIILFNRSKAGDRAIVSLFLKLVTENTAPNAETQLTGAKSFPSVPTKYACFPITSRNGANHGVLFIDTDGKLWTGTKLAPSQEYYGTVTYVTKCLTDSIWNGLSNI